MLGDRYALVLMREIEALRDVHAAASAFYGARKSGKEEILGFVLDELGKALERYRAKMEGNGADRIAVPG